MHRWRTKRREAANIAAVLGFVLAKALYLEVLPVEVAVGIVLPCLEHLVQATREAVWALFLVAQQVFGPAGRPPKLSSLPVVLLHCQAFHSALAMSLFSHPDKGTGSPKECHWTVRTVTAALRSRLGMAARAWDRRWYPERVAGAQDSACRLSKGRQRMHWKSSC